MRRNIDFNASSSSDRCFAIALDTPGVMSASSLKGAMATSFSKSFVVIERVIAGIVVIAKILVENRCCLCLLRYDKIFVNFFYVERYGSLSFSNHTVSQQKKIVFKFHSTIQNLYGCHS